MNWIPDIRILKTDERDETDEEYTSRVNDTIEKQKESLEKFKINKNKKEKKPIVQRPEDIPRNKVVTNLPSNISVKHIVDIEKSITSGENRDKDKNIKVVTTTTYEFNLVKLSKLGRVIEENGLS